MSGVVVRFYGRFVFVDRSHSGDLLVLAVNPNEAGLNFDQHYFWMTAVRTEVVRSELVQPMRSSFRTMSPLDVETRLIEHEVWNMAGKNVGIDVPGPFQWRASDSELADLVELTNPHVEIDPGAVNPANWNKLVSGTIRVPGGVATPGQLLKNSQYEFASYTGRVRNATLGRRPLADLVEIAFPDVGHVTFHVANRRNQPCDDITVQADRERQTVVTFSNVCAATHGEYDDEFVAFYDLLRPRHGTGPEATAGLSVDDRQVPVIHATKPQDVLSGINCFLAARVRMSG